MDWGCLYQGWMRCPYSRPNRGLHRLARWAIRSMAENLRVLEGVKGNGITD